MPVLLDGAELVLVARRETRALDRWLNRGVGPDLQSVLVTFVAVGAFVVAVSVVYHVPAARGRAPDIGRQEEGIGELDDDLVGKLLWLELGRLSSGVDQRIVRHVHEFRRGVVLRVCRVYGCARNADGWRGVGLVDEGRLVRQLCLLLLPGQLVVWDPHAFESLGEILHVLLGSLLSSGRIPGLLC